MQKDNWGGEQSIQVIMGTMLVSDGLQQHIYFVPFP